MVTRTPLNVTVYADCLSGSTLCSHSHIVLYKNIPKFPNSDVLILLELLIFCTLFLPLVNFLSPSIRLFALQGNMRFILYFLHEGWVNFILEHAMNTYRGGEYKCITTLSLTSSLDWDGLSKPRPDRFTPPPPEQRTVTHFRGGWAGPKSGQEGRGKSRLPPGFDPRTAQNMAQIASRSLSRTSFRKTVIQIVINIVNVAQIADASSEDSCL
jgi:hypothetical protein